MDIDDHNHELISMYTWWLSDHGYAYTTIRRKNVLMHRLIVNAPSAMEVDHINHNKLDNRESNLRLCNRQQQTRNKSSKVNSKSQFVGVTKDRYGLWEAQIKINGKGKKLGRFPIEKDAALIHDHYARKLFGEFANLNFPNEQYILPELEQRKYRPKYSSGYTGVVFDKKINKWYARVFVNGKQQHVGIYVCEIDAGKARDKYIIEHNLSASKLNFPEDYPNHAV